MVVEGVRRARCRMVGRCRSVEFRTWRCSVGWLTGEIMKVHWCWQNAPPSIVFLQHPRVYAVFTR